MSEDNVPRLAVGNPGRDDYGCAMQIVSWENGDEELSDYPDDVALPLARAVQSVNDTYCAHTSRTDDDCPLSVELLCAECSTTVLALAHRTTDTETDSESGMWSWAAALLERSVAGSDDERVQRALTDTAALAQAKADGETIEVAEQWADLPSCSVFDVGVHDLHIMDMARSVQHLLVDQARIAAIQSAPSRGGMTKRLERALCGVASSYVTVVQHGDRDLMLRAAHTLVDLWQERVLANEPTRELAAVTGIENPAVAA